VIRLLRQAETIAVALLVAALVYGVWTTPEFRDVHYLFDATSLYMEVAVMALAMTLVIISGNIDLSVASGLALIACACARLYANLHWPMPLVMCAALAVGVALGLFNGLLVTKLRLPSLTVTLGTLALYRGLAQVLVGDRSVGGFPEWFGGLDYRRVGDLVPYPLILFLSLAIVFALLLHKTVFGRLVYAIGTNEEATRFSGIRTDRVKLTVFVLSGLMMAVGALMMMSRLTTAQYSFAAGDELTVITAVVLGGTDIFGGRGTIFGTVVALLLMVVLKTAMDLRNIESQYQLAITGTLLVTAVLLANLLNKLSTLRRKRPPVVATSVPRPSASTEGNTHA
jgi:rhamnose transport system permease protein